MRKRIAGILLVGAMIVSSLAGCGGNATGTDVTTAAGVKEESKKIEKIKIYVPSGNKTDDVVKVMEKVNEISREKIGVEAELKVYEFGQWFQQYSLFLSGTEDIDILANYGGYLNAVSQGAAYDLTDLIQEHGKDIVEMEGDFLKSGEINGTQYAVPIYASYAWTMGLIYRKDVAEELGLTEKIAQVKTLEDWGGILEVVKEKKPEMTPYVTNGGQNAANFQYGTWDDLGNCYGVLMDGGKDSTVVNLFETEEYKRLCEIMYDWNQKGYSSKDIATQTDGFTVLTKNDAAFSTLGQTDFNTEFYQSSTCGKEMGAIELSTPVARTYNNVTYTIMSNSEHAEAAMKFMNLWFSDPEVGTLIAYGIEGEHYQLDENGMGEYLPGQDGKNCTYHYGSGISNTNRIRWNTESATYAEDLIKNNNEAQMSIGLGFTFDTSKVTNELTQLDNVCSKYQAVLECGTMDPETVLPEFQKALKDAGIDKVIAEKQAQLDAFLEEE